MIGVGVLEVVVRVLGVDVGVLELLAGVLDGSLATGLAWASVVRCSQKPS